MINIRSDTIPNNDDLGIKNSEIIISIHCCGYQKFITKDLAIKRDKGRDDYQIIYVVKGKCYFKIGNKVEEVTSGNFILIKPNQRQFYYYSHKDLTEVYWIHFSGYGIEEALQNLLLLEKPINYIGYDKRYISIFQLIINEIQIKNSSYQHIAAAYFYELLVYFSRELYKLAHISYSKNSEDFKEIIQLMYLKYKENLPISYYAEKCNLSIYRFIHKFKDFTGMSPLEYITKIRINIAKDLILSSSLSISEISDMIGYSNPLYFSRLFKKYCGVSPSLYKKESESK